MRGSKSGSSGVRPSLSLRLVTKTKASSCFDCLSLAAADVEALPLPLAALGTDEVEPEADLLNDPPSLPWTGLGAGRLPAAFFFFEVEGAGDESIVMTC